MGLPVSRTARAVAGEDRPLVLDRVLLLNERANKQACKFAVRAVEILTPLRARKRAAVQGDKRDPFGLAVGPSEGRKPGGAFLQRRDGGRARRGLGRVRCHPVTSARSPRR